MAQRFKMYDIDPLLLCRCGSTDPVEFRMVEVVGGRYVEAEAALDEIERLELELALSMATVQRFKTGCQELIDKYKGEGW